MIRGTKRKISRAASALEVPISARFHNRFDIEVVDAATGEVRQRARAFNLICNSFWTTIMNSGGSVSGYLAYIHYGRGSGTPAATDTTLFDKIAAVARVSDNTSTWMDASREFGYLQTFIVLAPETAVGETITEVGIGASESAILTHAMLEDMNGNPISIEKTSTDVIKIYATIFLHWQIDGWDSGSIVPIVESYNGAENLQDSNTLYPVIYALCGGGQGYYQPLACYFSPGYNADEAATTTFSPDSWAYNSSDKKLTIRRRFAVSEANLPIEAIRVRLAASSIATGAGSLILFPKAGGWYTPTQIVGEAVGTGDGAKTEFSTAFPIRSGAAVYVDGVAAVATTRGGSNAATSCARFMRTIAPNSTLSRVLFSGTSSRSGHAFLSRSDMDLIVENPYSSVGLSAVRHHNVSWNVAYTVVLSGSNDLETWDSVTIDRASGDASTWRTDALPAALQNCRFYKLRATSNNQNQAPAFDFVAKGITGGNIRFSTPPAAGAVITADYIPDCVAKDSNHVFDLTLEITLGEYSEV